MKKTFVVASLLAVALAVAPVTSAFARGRHDGGHHHRGGLIWGLANAVVATTVAVITAPIAIAAAITQAPRYYGPTFAGDAGSYYAPPPALGYYGSPGAPAYYSAPPVAQYYGPAAAPADYVPRTATYYAPPAAYTRTPAPGVYASRAVPADYGASPAAPYYASRQAYYAPRPAYYGPPPSDYGPPPGSN